MAARDCRVTLSIVTGDEAPCCIAVPEGGLRVQGASLIMGTESRALGLALSEQTYPSQ